MAEAAKRTENAEEVLLASQSALKTRTEEAMAFYPGELFVKSVSWKELAEEREKLMGMANRELEDFRAAINKLTGEAKDSRAVIKKTKGEADRLQREGE